MMIIGFFRSWKRLTGPWNFVTVKYQLCTPVTVTIFDGYLMDIWWIFDGYWWILMDIDGYWWIFDGYWWIFDGYWWILMDIIQILYFVISLEIFVHQHPPTSGAPSPSVWRRAAWSSTAASGHLSCSAAGLLNLPAGRWLQWLSDWMIFMKSYDFHWFSDFEIVSQ